jgi:predicted Zn-dependent protease with MMP-like domain
VRPPASPRGVLVSALAALTVAVGILTLTTGYNASPLIKAIQFLAVIGLGAILIGGVIMLVLVKLAGWRAPEDEFEQIVRRAERLAVESPWEDHDDQDDAYDWDEDHEYVDPSDEEDFKALVRSAVDELPLEFHRTLEHVAIVVADGGARVRVGRGRRAVYGQYQGDAVDQDYFHDRIVIFRDMLVRDFGHDPDALREQVLRTVRLELSHRLGIDGNVADS